MDQAARERHCDDNSSQILTVQLNSFSWNRNLARYVKAWKPEKTIELFQEMQQKCLSPVSFNFVPVLDACCNLGALEEAGMLINR
jgi:hypothetical protein